MQGHTLHAGQDVSWHKRVKSLRESAIRLKATRDQAVRDLEVRRTEVSTITARIDVLVRVSELFRALMDKLVLDHVRSIEGIVSEGLHTIFHDQDLSFTAEVSSRYNRIAIDFSITQHGENVSISGHPLESFGGGPASIASLVLRILTMMRLKRWPILLLDETLAAVSGEYVDQTGRFLQQLSKSTGIDILFVTHKRSFVDHATIAYEGTEVGDGPDRHLHLTRLRGVS